MFQCSTAKQSAVLGALVLSVAMFAATSWAGVKPGDVITPQNATQVKDLVSPGVYYMVQHGMHMNVVPTERVDWPPPYKDATEKYSAQVRLSEDHRSLVGYVAGQPFPLIDTNDPYVGSKIMWNNVFRPISTDDYDLRFFDCQIEYVNPGHDQRVINDIQVGHYAGYDLVGRTEVEPMPVDYPIVQRPPRRLGRLISKPIQLPPGIYHMISPSLVTPRDFDLSPYFEVIKFNLIAGARFDYRKIIWADYDTDESIKLEKAG